MKFELFSLFEYGAWVNKRLLAAAEPLEPEQFTRKLISGFSSVHLTLVHILGAEELWLSRWQGQSPKTILAPKDLPGLAEIRAYWQDMHHRRQMNLLHLEEPDLAAMVRWTNLRGQAFELPVWQVILHSANHSTHHRSEVAAMLSALGHEPESTDLLEFYLANAGQAWKPSPGP